MIDAIIFSKNRACQLDLLLRSIKQNAPDFFDNIIIIYTYTNDDFYNGYNKLILKFPKYSWCNEGDFKQDVLWGIEAVSQYVCFFVDDNILYRSPNIDRNTIDFLFQSVENFGCFSFRLGWNTTVQTFYTFPPRQIQINHPIAKTTIGNDLVLLWEWDKLPRHGNNFEYPFSVDGHIYSKSIFYYLDYDFDTPNSLEGRFNITNLYPIMGCLEHSCVFNNPINLVGSSNNDAGRWHGYTLESLNQAFLDGKTISLDICNTDVIGCHQETEIQLI